MPTDLSSGLLDGRAFFPESWQTGIPGVFLLFVVGPMGSGIPLGVLMARDMGLNPLITAFIYLLSDFLLAVIVEPELAVLRWLGQRNAFFGRIGAFFIRLTRRTGLQDSGAHGPLGLILLSFTVEPISSRAAGAAAGHGFFAGWTFAILGDMAYFGMIMASTLWVSSIFGDDRVAIGIVLIGMWVIPMLIRRMRRGTASQGPTGSPAPATLSRLATASASAAGSASGSGSAPTQAPRRPPTRQNGRRRRATRGLHR